MSHGLAPYMTAAERADDFLQRSLGRCDQALSKPPAERICPLAHFAVVRELAHEGLKE